MYSIMYKLIDKEENVVFFVLNLIRGTTYHVVPHLKAFTNFVNKSFFIEKRGLVNKINAHFHFKLKR